MSATTTSPVDSTSPTTATTTTTTTSTTATTITNAIVKTVEAIISSTAPAASSSSSTSAHPTPTQSSTSSSTPTETLSMGGPEEKLSVKDLSQTLQHFGVVDYLVFVAMLAVCAVIGVYFGFIEKKQKATKKKKGQLAGKDGAGAVGVEERRGSEALDYLVGGRQMKVFPVALSLVASFVSGISLLGTSTEIYVYGTQYAFILVTLAISGAISWYIFLPVFCNLQLTSTYEYFEMRFNKTVRVLASALFTCSNMIWLPVVIYVPALAFNQVTGINIHIITPIVCVVCIFYTTAGGLKAVVWTDVIQTFVMVIAIFFVIIKGTMDVGGLGVVIQRNFESGRLEWPEWTFDPKVRMSMLAMMLGNVGHNAYQLGCNQIIIQRYNSLPGKKEMAQTSLIFIIGLVVLNAVCLYNGLLLYATYYDCDPLTTKLAVAKDQLVPLLVVQSLSSFPGVPGMFVAGVFSAALSSLSTGLNSLSAVFLEDYIKPLRRKPMTEHEVAITVRLCTVIIGVLSVALVFVVERMGTHVMQLTMTISAFVNGPLLGLFLMGLLIPSINSKYFQLRYGAGIRNLGAVLFIVDTTIWLPLCMYIPAITYNQVTGTGIYVITPIVCLICTFYTCVGGLKAVIWSDVIQSFVMFGSILAVCIKGTYDVGGLPVVLQRNEESGRLNAPEWTWDPTVRLSMLSVIVGGTLHKMQSSDVNQISIQRFLSLPSYEHAKRCMLVFTLLLIFLLSCCCYMGLVSYAVYHDCDPNSTKLAKASDQLPSLLMMRTLGSLPGLPGLFVAGVFSAALSSLSTGLNSLACVLTQDIVQPLLKKPLTERQTAFWLRAIIVGFGFSCIGMVKIVEKLGNVVPLATTIGAVSMGPLLGIYGMGVGLPWVKGKSVMVGSLVSFLALAWICVNAQLGQMRGEIRHPKMPVSVENCDYTFDNATVFHTIHDYTPSERNLYHLSFFWYTALGGFISTIVSLLASLFFGWEDLTQMDPALITPCMRRFLPNKNYQAVKMEDLFKRKDCSDAYFERRFDRRIRIFGSCLFVVMNILWQPICIYVPALTLNQVSGISVAKIVPMTSLVCILYTSVGGIKGVVWTDVIQGFVMIGSMAIVIVKGTLDMGGLNVVLDRNRQFERLVGPDMTLDPTVRMGVLALFIGGAFFKLQANGINQSIVQRYLTLPNFRAVKQAIILSLTGFMIVLLMCVYIGMLAFAEFYHCDPITTGLARAKDQVIPLYVMKSVGTFPGLVGLFVAGVFSAALSSLSTALNSLSGVILTDFVEPFRKKPLTERQTAYVLRGVVVAFGLISMASVPIVEKLGLVMQLSSTVAAITCGPLLGAFSVGMLLPFVKTEYFERRFSRRMRLFGAALFVLKAIVWLPIAVYVPALTFNQVTGIGIHTITPIVIIICTFYTCVGGLKGVVYTDVVQSVIMFGSLFVIMIKGTLDLGGFGVVWQRNQEGGRLNMPDWTMDPTVRLSVFSVFVGGSFFKLQSTSINQATVQRFMSLPSLGHIKQTLWTFSIGLILLYCGCIYIGLVCYATYYDCDPMSTGLAGRRDQLVPLLVMRVLGVLPGLPGLFVSAVFSAALSSLSTLLNSLAAVILEDFVRPKMGKAMKEHHVALTMRLVVIIFGISSIFMVYVVEKLGMVLQLSATLQSSLYGPMLGVFTVGMLMPWVGEKSIFVGSICAFLTMAWIAVNAQIANVTGTFRHTKLPISIEHCDYEFDMNRYLNSTLEQEHHSGSSVYHISFLLYAMLGALLTIIISNLATCIFGRQDVKDVDEELLAPFVQRYLRKNNYYESVELKQKNDPNER